MSFTLSRNYEYKIFEPGEIKNAIITAYSGVLNVTEDNLTVSGDFIIAEGIRESRDLTIKDIVSICEIGKNIRYFNIQYIHNGDLTKAYRIFFFRKNDQIINLYIDFPDSEKAIEFISVIEKILNIKRVEYNTSEEINFNTAIKELENRILGIEEKIKKINNKLNCFISYRFNQTSKNIVLELTRFLNLVGVTVITGAGYEPRRISEKVLSRLEQPIDFIIYLITKEGESTWTRDEMAISLAKNYYIVPLVETGAHLEQGILGDWEYISFEKISDTFISLLESINFIIGEKGKITC